MSDYDDLGNRRRTISTASAHAQLWFDRRLSWTYGFNHEEAVRCEEAEAVYRADQHPENVWSLHGYHECQERLGKYEPARMIEQRLTLVRADVPIVASCAWRLSVVG